MSYLAKKLKNIMGNIKPSYNYAVGNLDIIAVKLENSLYEVHVVRWIRCDTEIRKIIDVHTSARLKRSSAIWMRVTAVLGKEGLL